MWHSLDHYPDFSLSHASLPIILLQSVYFICQTDLAPIPVSVTSDQTYLVHSFCEMLSVLQYHLLLYLNAANDTPASSTVLLTQLEVVK